MLIGAEETTPNKFDEPSSRVAVFWDLNMTYNREKAVFLRHKHKFRYMKKNKNQYVQANKDWLVAKSQEDGVMALPKGIFYKVLAEGDAMSATPSPSSVITAHYTGKTIDGATFDSSRGDVPLACRLRDLIEGWIIAMQQMHIGDRWEVYIPAEMGYGKFSQPGIPGGSTLIFDIELLAIN